MIIGEVGVGELLAATTSAAVLITFLWKGIGKPNKTQDEKIIRLEDGLASMESDINIIKVNHLSHIEKDIKGLRETMVRVETILNERLPLNK